MRVLKDRENIILVFVLIMMGLIIIKLSFMIVVEGDKWKAEANSLSTKSILTPAPRGEIYDRNGNLLAGNIPSFALTFSRDGMENEDLNESASALIKILESENEKYFDNFSIKLKDDGTFSYTYEEEIAKWLKSEDMPSNFTAEQAFNEIRLRNNINKDLDVYEAQEQLQTLYGESPPISVKLMKFTKEIDLKNFLELYKIDEGTSPKKAFKEIREYYEIPKSMSDKKARKIIRLRGELTAQGYNKYSPAKVAAGVSENTVIKIEENSIPGVAVVTETERYYPNKNTASHVIGYLGKISDSQKEEYVDKLGYDRNDLIGLEGIEKSLESTLKGKSGVKQVQVNAQGEMVRVLDETEAEKGKDVFLSIDLDLQKTAEDALSQALAKMKYGGVFQSKWGNFKFDKAYPNANVGAAVAIDVDTGDILALANNPDFDPNKFSKGISTKDWNELQSENPRDPLSPLPLYNVATMTAVQPGSIFKPITAIAALESGLDANRQLVDYGEVMVGNRAYPCLLWTRSHGTRTHGSVNLYKAMEVSCNYYFFDIGTGMNLNDRSSLGFSPEMNIDRLTSYAEQFGLGKKTGIEIAETVVPVPTAERKIENTKAMLRSYLIGRAEFYFQSKVTEDYDLLMANIDKIVSWSDENPSVQEIVDRMAEVGVKKSHRLTLAETCKYTYYNFAKWTLGDELNISIGQGENAYTPLQMANYIATIGNGGKLNKTTLVRAIEGKGVVEKSKAKKADVTQEHLSQVITAMGRVVKGSGGSLYSAFAGFPIDVAGKTGTAQRSGKINPPDEVEYIKGHLSSINSSLSWADVEKEMIRLMDEYPDIYSSKNTAVRRAVINLSLKLNSKLSETYITDRIDMYKSDYDNFAWVVAMAPADNPKIAVAVLIFQGGTSANAAPVAKEIIGTYLDIEKEYEDFDTGTEGL